MITFQDLLLHESVSNNDDIKSFQEFKQIMKDPKVKKVTKNIQTKSGKTTKIVFVKDKDDNLVPINFKKREKKNANVQKHAGKNKSVQK